MFSPDNFHDGAVSKPQKTVTTTTPRHLTPRPSPSITVTRESGGPGSPTPSFPQHPPTSPSLDKWEFHAENFGHTGSLAPRSTRTPPPLERMISAPGNLQQFTHRGDKAQFSIQHFQVPSPTHTTPATSSNESSPREYSPPAVTRDSRRTKREPFQPPALRTQASTPSHIHFLGAPAPAISRNIKKKTIKPRTFLNQTKKLPSTSDLPLSFVRSNDRSPEYSGERHFRPPPLQSRHSESMLEIPRLHSPISGLALPSLSCMVSGSPVESPNDSPYSSCNESDQEMREVERKTSKMSIKHLIDG